MFADRVLMLPGCVLMLTFAIFVLTNQVLSLVDGVFVGTFQVLICMDTFWFCSLSPFSRVVLLRKLWREKVLTLQWTWGKGDIVFENQAYSHVTEARTASRRISGTTCISAPVPRQQVILSLRLSKSRISA